MSILPGLQFGSGFLLATPQTSSGNPAPNPTPVSIGVLQNVKLTFGADIKTLFGQNQWPVDSAIGKRTIKGSFELAQVSNQLISQLFTGDAVTTGSVLTVLSQAASIPAMSPYTVTPTVPGSGTFLADEGVTYALTGVPLTAVASGPMTGQYSVNASTGVYTFAAADEGLGVLISFRYTSTTIGSTITSANKQMGYGPVLGLNVVFNYDGNGIGFYLPNVRLGKLDMSSKLEDYLMATVDFEAFAGAAGVPFQSYMAF